MAPRASKLSSPSRAPFTDLSCLTNSLSHSSAKRKIRKPRKARPGDPSFVLSSTAIDASDHGTGQASDPLEIKPLYDSGDLSLTVGRDWNARSHGISCLTQGGDKMFAAVTDGRIYSLPLSSLQPSTSTSFVHDEATEVLYHPTQLGNSLYNRLALCPDERTLAIGCNNGNVVLWDTKVRKAALLGQGGSTSFSSSSSSTTFGLGMDGGESEEEEDRGNPFRGTSTYISNGNGNGNHSNRRQREQRLREGHRVNCEINALDWCFDAYAGWRLATCGDDMTVRIWESDLGV